MSGSPARASRDGVRLDVRLTPKGGRDRVDGVGTLSDGRSVLLARVSAPPEKGAANRALLRLVADWLGIPPSRVSLAAGDTARIKSLEIEIEAAAVAAAIAKLTPR